MNFKKSDGQHRHFFVLRARNPGLFEMSLYYEVTVKIKPILLILDDFDSNS